MIILDLLKIVFLVLAVGLLVAALVCRIKRGNDNLELVLVGAVLIFAALGLVLHTRNDGLSGLAYVYQLVFMALGLYLVILSGYTWHKSHSGVRAR